MKPPEKKKLSAKIKEKEDLEKKRLEELKNKVKIKCQLSKLIANFYLLNAPAYLSAFVSVSRTGVRLPALNHTFTLIFILLHVLNNVYNFCYKL